MGLGLAASAVVPRPMSPANRIIGQCQNLPVYPGEQRITGIQFLLRRLLIPRVYLTQLDRNTDLSAFLIDDKLDSAHVSFRLVELNGGEGCATSELNRRDHSQIPQLR
jgi:hypothetical protein